LFYSSVSFFFFLENSATLGTTSFQKAIFSTLYLHSTRGFKSRTRYACSFSVNSGHLSVSGTGWVVDGGLGFGDLVKEEKPWVSSLYLLLVELITQPWSQA